MVRLLSGRHIVLIREPVVRLGAAMNFEKRQARGFLFTRRADGQWAGPTT